MLEIDGGMNGHCHEVWLLDWRNFCVAFLGSQNTSSWTSTSTACHLEKVPRNQYWPILCEVRNVQNVAPFLVGLFYGQGKPPDVNDFLQDFVQELSELLQGVYQLAGVGGSSVGNNIRGVLGQLMTQNVAMKFSWLGQREKIKFKNLENPDVIYTLKTWKPELAASLLRAASQRVAGRMRPAVRVFETPGVTNTMGLGTSEAAAFCFDRATPLEPDASTPVSDSTIMLLGLL
ncbi:hypothetical protein HPB47_007015 [Ixodes persulcatus]|uniref:Uncharacterized protein n=1 Tax=Ixodes persulcatus TaxID=34615 RepID=A0AC60P8J1_IXOPE|nr:hypothetical protein HPB47_007015 [Ixodes persulcatus]